MSYFKHFHELNILLLIIGISSFQTNVTAQLTVDLNVGASDGVQNILMGGGVEVNNITFGGNESTQIGFFQCNNCGLGLSSGLILGSGNVQGAIGPNNTGNYSLGPPSGVDGFGDPDLQVLASNTINNAAILQFDFVPTGDEIAFDFVFSSEEYPEFVNSINDAFGFFLSGPGISGPFTNNAANIALIPNSTAPITINSVNHLLNNQYYVSNNNPAIHNVQADGFTTVLTAKATVECGQPYHIKIAIGDASDGSYDSWVFLKEGSFSSSPLEIGFEQPTLAPELGNAMFEGCEGAPITFYRPPCTFGDYVFDVSYTGTAINGVDFPELPTTITIPDGDESVVVILDPYDDDLEEEVENLLISIQMTLASGEVVDIEFEVLIYDHPPINVTIVADDNNVCPDTPVNLLAIPDNALGGESYLWSTTATTIGVEVSSPETATYEVTLMDGCGYEAKMEHTVDVLPYSGPLTVPESPFQLCTNAPTGAIFYGGIPPYTYEYDDSILQIIDNSGLLSSAIGVTTELTITDVCDNTANFIIDINVCDTDFPNIFTPNGDSSNPLFVVKGIEAFPESTLLIYNRWGKLIFESNNYRNNWSADEVADGAYFYIFKRSDGNDYSGSLTIQR